APDRGKKDGGGPRPRRQEPGSGDAEDSVAQGRTEIPRRRRRARHCDHPCASPPEHFAAVEDGRGMIGWHQSPPSCPGLSRASTSFLPPVIKDVDGGGAARR